MDAKRVDQVAWSQIHSNKNAFASVLCFKAAAASKSAGACQVYSPEDTPTVFGATSISYRD